MSGLPDPAASDSAAARLKSFIERVERLEEEKRGIADDIKEVYAEAKGAGFEVKVMRQVVKLRKMEADARREQQELLDLYMRALGMLADTPLGESAIDREKLKRAPRNPGPFDGDDAGETPAERKPADRAKPQEPSPEDIALQAALDARNKLAGMGPEEAKALGKSDHAAGKKITANPFPPRSKNRTAWEKGWCEADGSDGMALPGEVKAPAPGDDGADDGASADAPPADDGKSDDGEPGDDGDA